jgi:hypothetical protein
MHTSTNRELRLRHYASTWEKNAHLDKQGVALEASLLGRAALSQVDNLNQLGGLVDCEGHTDAAHVLPLAARDNGVSQRLVLERVDEPSVLQEMGVEGSGFRFDELSALHEIDVEDWGLRFDESSVLHETGV